MAPFKSSLARSGKKLIGFFNQSDLSFRGQINKDKRPPSFSSSGGTKITSGDYTYHVFTADTPAPESSLVISGANLSKTAQVLVVGGGGGGANDDGGGGGAGSAVYDPSLSISAPSTIPVTVGGGAAKGTGAVRNNS